MTYLKSRKIIAYWITGHGSVVQIGKRGLLTEWRSDENVACLKSVQLVLQTSHPVTDTEGKRAVANMFQ